MTEWGGDSTQILATAQAVRSLGVDVEMSETVPKCLEGFSLCHVFNTQKPEIGLPLVRQLKAAGIPVAVSTIYWDFDHVERTIALMDINPSKFFLIRALGRVNWRTVYFIRWAASLKEERSRYRGIRCMLENADLLLPNSIAEMEIIIKKFVFPALRAKSFTVVNGVRTGQATPELGEQLVDCIDHRPLPDEYILSVGTLAPLKGQLLLLRALLKHAQLPVVFAGRGLESSYGQECITLGRSRGNTFFVGHVEPEMMNLLYARARVHALPSLRESPGLANLEAGANGVKCVVSIHGPVNEYFGGDVWFCDPASLESIRGSVLAAWGANQERADRLRMRIEERFTWTRAGEETVAAYRWLLSNVNL